MGERFSPAATIEERKAEPTSVATSTQRLSPRSHPRRSTTEIIGEHNERLAFIRSRAGFSSNRHPTDNQAGSGQEGGAPPTADEVNGDDYDDYDDRLNTMPSADDFANAMGIDRSYGGPRVLRREGEGSGDSSGDTSTAPISTERGPDPNDRGIIQQQQLYFQQQRQQRPPAQQQEQTDSLMKGVSADTVSSLPNKQQLYGNSDLSQVDKDYIFEGLRRLYNTKVLPLEMASKYSNFASPPMSYSDFEAKPMVLIIGQYSVGKTSFIRSLVKQDFPGQRIGPEPTTDRFTAIMHSDSKSHLDPQGGRRQSPGQAGPGG